MKIVSTFAPPFHDPEFGPGVVPTVFDTLLTVSRWS
jgi:hypothetical protein